MTDAAFWDRIAPKYALQPISNVDAYEETLTRTRSYLSADTTALELGCGTGSTALRLSPGTRHYVGTDISPGMIDIAQGKLDDSADHLEFRVAGVGELAEEKAEFNTVLAFNLLHLVPDLDRTLSDIHALLPEGGLFISKTPALKGKWYYRPLIGAMRLIGKAPRVLFFSVEELDTRIAAAGFRIVETGLYPPTAPSRFIVARKV